MFLSSSLGTYLSLPLVISPFILSFRSSARHTPWDWNRQYIIVFRSSETVADPLSTCSPLDSGHISWRRKYTSTLESTYMYPSAYRSSLFDSQEYNRGRVTPSLQSKPLHTSSNYRIFAIRLTHSRANIYQNGMPWRYGIKFRPCDSTRTCLCGTASISE